MPELWMDVDVALSEVPINIVALIDDTDFKTREEGVTYNQSGLDLLWNFTTTAGAFSQTAVTPTDTGGDYDWVNQGNGYYTIEIPGPGTGGSIYNDTEGIGWFSGFATGILPWRGPTIGFRAAAVNDALIDASLATTAEISDAVNDEVFEGSWTFRKLTRIISSALFGKSSNNGQTFRDLADTKNRIAATCDVNGNRTAVTLDGD